MARPSYGGCAMDGVHCPGMNSVVDSVQSRLGILHRSNQAIEKGGTDGIFCLQQSYTCTNTPHSLLMLFLFQPKTTLVKQLTSFSIKRMTSTMSKEATPTSSVSSSSSSSSWKERLDTILQQNRHVLNFEHYTVSKEHMERMKELAQLAPELYDNPEITPRSTWFDHVRFNENSQMPPFHVHYRTELQHIIHCIYKAYNENDDDNDDKQKKQLSRAFRSFSGCMRGLNGHVSIEEYACFPVYQDCYPKVNIRFLYEDHKSLKKAEHKAMNKLGTLVQQDSVTKEDILECLQHMMDFDDHLMGHLGEEEEIVVPMSLTEQDIWF
eukprot:scaffold4304_cov71-Cylindrotheca_fusiformis.AAC.4